MTKEQIQILGSAVGRLIAVDRSGVIVLLNRFGVSVTDNTSTKMLISATIDACLDDATFFNEFKKLLALNVKASGQTLNAEGGGGDIWGAATGLLGAATSIFTTIKTTDAQRKLAAQQAELENTRIQGQLAQGNQMLEIERLRLQQVQAQASQPKNNMLIYVGVGVGALLLVGLMVIVVKKK